VVLDAFNGNRQLRTESGINRVCGRDTPLSYSREAHRLHDRMLRPDRGSLPASWATVQTIAAVNQWHVQGSNKDAALITKAAEN
jgi:hypothetical protein